MSNDETIQTLSQTNYKMTDEEVRAEVLHDRFSHSLTKEEMKGKAAMSAEEAYYHLRILPTRDNFCPKFVVECVNYPNGCATCCNKVFTDEKGEKLITCAFGKRIADTVEPMVLSMLEEAQ